MPGRPEDVTKRSDVRYGDEERQTYDVYFEGTTAERRLVVYVHGGAWRSGDKSEYDDMAKRIVSLADCTVVVVNYRLSPRNPEDGPAVHHPTHAKDVQMALAHILVECSPSHMYTVGHSAGAHILGSIFLASNSHLDQAVAAVVRGVMGVEGIYDIDLLLRAHPDYRDFIEGAFGVEKSYESVSPAHANIRSDGAQNITWMIVQSVGDVLIKQDQADAMLESLSKQLPTAQVQHDFRSQEGHFEMLQTVGFAEIVRDFITSL